MGLSIPHLLLLLLIVLLVFGAGRLPRIMHDIGKGMRSLKEGLKAEDETPNPPPSKPLPHSTIDAAVTPSRETTKQD